MTGALELSDWEFETTVINMLSVLMDKVDNMQYKQRDGNSKKELKRNAREKRNSNRSEECF